ncbi:MAG: chemotaxis protein CheB, partial [Pseudomonadales bacterium]|nr:chemotaxis protein CheB [Pseudomonadales bacterium]
ATCVVYGMPRAAFERGAAAQVLPLSAIADAMIGASRREEVRRVS